MGLMKDFCGHYKNIGNTQEYIHEQLQLSHKIDVSCQLDRQHTIPAMVRGEDDGAAG